MADEPVADRGPDRRRLARVPGVLRPSPPGARRARGAVRRASRRPGRRPRCSAALDAAEAIVVCPSNPIVSVGPILAVPGMRDAVAAAPAPAASRSRRSARSSAAGRSRDPRTGCSPRWATRRRRSGVARLYAELVDVFVLDAVDADARRRRRGARAAPGRRRHDHDRRRLAGPPRGIVLEAAAPASTDPGPASCRQIDESRALESPCPRLTAGQCGDLAASPDVPRYPATQPPLRRGQSASLILVRR